VCVKGTLQITTWPALWATLAIVVAEARKARGRGAYYHASPAETRSAVNRPYLFLRAFFFAAFLFTTLFLAFFFAFFLATAHPPLVGL